MSLSTSATAKAACAGGAAACVASLPSDVQVLAACVGAIVGLWGSAIQSWDSNHAARWAVVLVGQMLSAITLGAAGSVALHQIDVTLLTGVEGMTVAVLSYAAGLPEWLTALGLAATSQLTLPLVVRLLKRRTGS
jgi:hypothetical protein